MNKGERPRGFSVSITALKGGDTRVIVWRRGRKSGTARVKLGDFKMARHETAEVPAQLIGGESNGRLVIVMLSVQPVG